MFLLRSGEPVPAARLVQQLGVSRPVLARLVAEAGDQVLRIGKARATVYVARGVANAGGAWSLWRMQADASLEELGTLYALNGECFQFEPSGERPNLVRPVEQVAGHFPGLPWFLDDLRPQGFLGRTLAHRCGAQFRTAPSFDAGQGRANPASGLGGPCYWEQVADCDRIGSDSLRRLASQNRDVAARLERSLGG